MFKLYTKFLTSALASFPSPPDKSSIVLKIETQLRNLTFSSFQRDEVLPVEIGRSVNLKTRKFFVP